MKPLRPRYNRINAEVERLLTKSKVRSAPVPVEAIAKGEGANVVFQNFNNEISGLLIRRPGAIVIGVDKKQAAQRQRFTVGHELGHLLLHDGDEVHVDKDFRVNFRSASSSTAEDVEEIEANTFAATLLMPMQFLLKDLQGVVVDIEDQGQVAELATAYEVSLQAMTFRLTNLFARERGRL